MYWVECLQKQNVSKSTKKRKRKNEGALFVVEPLIRISPKPRMYNPRISLDSSYSLVYVLTSLLLRFLSHYPNLKMARKNGLKF